MSTLEPYTGISHTKYRDSVMVRVHDFAFTYLIRVMYFPMSRPVVWGISKSGTDEVVG